MRAAGTRKQVNIETTYTLQTLCGDRLGGSRCISSSNRACRGVLFTYFISAMLNRLVFSKSYHKVLSQHSPYMQVAKRCECICQNLQCKVLWFQVTVVSSVQSVEPPRC